MINHEKGTGLVVFNRTGFYRATLETCHHSARHQDRKSNLPSNWPCFSAMNNIIWSLVWENILGYKDICCISILSSALNLHSLVEAFLHEKSTNLRYINNTTVAGDLVTSCILEHISTVWIFLCVIVVKKWAASNQTEIFTSFLQNCFIGNWASNNMNVPVALLKP